MPRLTVQWPVDEMRTMYEVEEKSAREIAAILGSPEWQARWVSLIGRGYRPSAKVVGKVCKRFGFAMRSRGCCPGSKNGRWTGGRNVDKSGYILVYQPDHPHATKAGYVREHRLVAERVLGRYLTRTEVVHHADDDPSNNDPGNLVVYDTNGLHLSDTLAGRCPDWTPDGRRRIAAGVEKAAKLKRRRPRVTS